MAMSSDCTKRYSAQYCPGLVLFDRIATAIACKISKESYFDINVSAGPLVQATGGAQFSCSAGLHPYGGIGVGLSPPVSVAVSLAPNQSISERLGCGVQGYYGLGGQGGLGGGSTDSVSEYGEIGVGSPQISYSCYYVGPRP